MPPDAASPNNPVRRPALGAGLVCFKGDSVLLIKIGKPPRLGEWSIPGGHVEWGETTRAAALRETLEETGVTAEITGMIEVIDAFFYLGAHWDQSSGSAEPDRHLALVDFVGRWISGEPKAGDDAMHAEFVPLSEIDGLGLWGETLRIIRQGACMMGLAAAAPNG